MLGFKLPEKMFVYTKPHKKGEISPEITSREVQESLANYFSDFNVSVSFISDFYSVTATPKNDVAKNKLKKLGISTLLFPRLSFSYSVGQSLMFRIHISNSNTYAEYKAMFDEIALTMRLDVFDPFPADSVTILHS